jgi:hypothetical protein
MAQVTRTTNELIVNSLYMLGELGVGETPNAFMLSTGLELINELIDKFANDSIYIPFLTTVSFNMVPGQAEYTLSTLTGANVNSNRVVDLSMANYTVQNQINYPIKIVNKAQYYGIVKQTNLNSRPSIVFLNKQATESIITFFPAPDQAYPCQLKCKVMIDKLDEHELLTELPPFYYGFMKRALARTFLQYYPSGNWPQTAEDEYDDYYKILKNANETDLTVRPSVLLNANQPWYWQMILAYP